MTDYKVDVSHSAFIAAVNSLKLRFPGSALSEKMDMSKGTVSKYLKGKAEGGLDPSPDFIEKFEESFNVKVSDFEEEKTDRSEKKKADKTVSLYIEQFNGTPDNDKIALYIIRNEKALMENPGFKTWVENVRLNAKLEALNDVRTRG